MYTTDFIATQKKKMKEFIKDWSIYKIARQELLYKIKDRFDQIPIIILITDYRAINIKISTTI